MESAYPLILLNISRAASLNPYQQFVGLWNDAFSKNRIPIRRLACIAGIQKIVPYLSAALTAPPDKIAALPPL